MRRLIALLMAVILFSAPWAHGSEEPIAIAIPDTYTFADPVQAGEGWYGIFMVDGDFTLEATQVNVAPFPYDSGGGTAEVGVRISVPANKKPVALIRGIKNVRTGKLAASRPPSDPWPFLYPGQSVDVTVTNWSLEREYRVTALGVAKQQPGVSFINYRDYALRLSKGTGGQGGQQVLLSLPEFSSHSGPRIVWAGDLDRDGKPDFILDRQQFYTRRDIALFLSSAAQDGELVGLVAEWTAGKGC